MARYYPELLSAKFFVNVPFLMSWVFTAMKAFLSKETLRKFRVIASGKALVGELGEDAVRCVGRQCFLHFRQRVEASAFQRAVHAHQDRPRLGAAFAAAAVAGFAHQYRRADLALGAVVRRRHPRHLRERQQVRPVGEQPVRQPPGVGVRPLGAGQLRDPRVQRADLRVALGLRHGAVRRRDADRVGVDPPELFGEPRPVIAGAVGPVLHPGQFPQQVRPAFLVHPRAAVVDAPEVGHQNPLEFLGEPLLQRRPATRGVDGVIGLARRAKTPEPAERPVQIPAGFVGVEHARPLAVLPDLLVPRPQRVGQAVPHLMEAALGDFQLQVGVEDLGDLARGGADAVVQKGREGDGAVAEGARRQGVGHDGLDLLFAARAPVAVDGVLGRLGVQVGGQIFDDAFAGTAGAFEFAAAVGAGGQLMVDLVVDALGNRADMAIVAGLGARLPLAAGGFGDRFVERRPAARRRVRRSFGGDGRRELEQKELGFEGVAVEETLGLHLGERAGAERAEERGIEPEIGFGRGGNHTGVIE